MHLIVAEEFVMVFPLSDTLGIVGQLQAHKWLLLLFPKLKSVE